METKIFKNQFELSKAVVGVLQIPAAADPASVDAEKRAEALRYSIDRGVNYVNLGFPYFFEAPEKACAYVKQALSGGYRERVQLALNLPASQIKKRSDLDEWLERELAWFGVDRVDVCVISGIYRANWHTLKALDIKLWLDQMLENGTFRQVGFGFHDDPHYITPICTYYDKWSFLQVDYSYMDERHHPGNGGVIVANNYGLAVIASEPLKGGRLARNIPERVQAVWDGAETKRTPAEWAIRYVYNNPGIFAAQFEFADVGEAKACLDIAEASAANAFGLAELLTVRGAVEAYEQRLFFTCPACRCCMPCPRGVDAPRIGELYNDVCLFGDAGIPLFLYRLEGDGTPQCVNCGACASICPKKNPLPEAFRKLDALSKNG